MRYQNSSENPAPQSGSRAFRPMNWHALDLSEVVRILQTDSQSGLTEQEVMRRLEVFGPNVLIETGVTHWSTVLLRQFMDILIVILIIAAFVSLSVGEVVDAVTILIIVVVNGLMGFTQEWNAEKAVEALKKMLSPRSRVNREGHDLEIDASFLVPGDVVYLDTGNRVPADMRLIETIDLRIDESSLTGESDSVGKETQALEPETPLAERASMAWMGTAVTNGRGTGIVVETGMKTEFGQIAELTQSVDEDTTPLQRKLAVLGKQLGFFAVLVSVLIAVAGWYQGKGALEMFMTAVALAVAVVPEGLPAVVTITLALGIRGMVRKRALLRRLQAAEALGSATVICTDKTGTLTENEMTVQKIWIPEVDIELTGVGYDPIGEYRVEGKRISPVEYQGLMALLETGLKCNHARLIQSGQGWSKIGEPTEAALVTAAHKAGLQEMLPFQTASEFAFNSSRKRMTVIEAKAPMNVAHVKGAPEVILARCSHILVGEEVRGIQDKDRESTTASYERMAQQGLRTLALARRMIDKDREPIEDEVEKDLVLLGIVGIIDPPREEVPDAIETARKAGIRVMMITGDAATTGSAIASRIGLGHRRVVVGGEISEMGDAELRSILEHPVLFARTTPEHKLRIVSILKEMGHVVGMTGDGVNDAPALKKSDIGIAMGIRGTDVAKGASDMVLTDDNFASIISAIEEGRRQYDNIQKFIRFLLSSNVGEIVAILMNIVIGGPLILLPAQILWMNLVTDGIVAVALGIERAESGVMQRPPRSPFSPILDRNGILIIVGLGGYMGLATLGIFQFYLGNGDSLHYAQTMAFTGIVLFQMINVFNFRGLQAPLKIVGFFSNPWILVAWVLSFGLQLCAIYVPFLQKAFHTVPLQLMDWGILLALSLPILIVSEGSKSLLWDPKIQPKAKE